MRPRRRQPRLLAPWCAGWRLLFTSLQPTLNRQYGVPLAVNVGDAMNAMSVRLLRKNLELLGPELTSSVFDEMDHMSLQTIEGQAMELGWIRENNSRTTDEDYLLMVLKKSSWYSFIHPRASVR